MKRWGVIVALVAATQLLVASTAHAQASWAPPRAYEPPPPLVGPRVILRSDSPNVRLQQHTQLRWRDVCLAPCGTTVDPSALFLVAGVVLEAVGLPLLFSSTSVQVH